MSRRDPRAGFTLIEVLAALAITAALVGVALPFATRLATRWWVGERGVEAADGWMQGIARISDDLAAALPMTLPSAGQRRSAFAAGPTFIQFVRPALGASPSSDLQTVRFEIRAGASGSRLVRRVARFAAETFFEAMAADPEGTIILDGPARLSFMTLGPDDVPLRLWPEGGPMPRAVELVVTATAREWPAQTSILLPIVARTFAPPPVPPRPATGVAASAPFTAADP